jgi:hypothetical protein
MSQLLLLRPKVSLVFRVGRNDDGDSLHDLQSVAGESAVLLRVVRQEAQAAEAEVRQDLRADAVVALVRVEAQLLIRLDGVEPRVLQRVGPELVLEADAASFLVHVEHHALAGLLHHAHALLHLLPAVAPHRAERVAGEAFGVHAHEDRLFVDM